MYVVVVSHTQAKSIEEVEEAESLYKELFSSPTSDGSFGAEFVDLCKTTTIGQRLTQVDTQPENMADVYPRHKHLVVKRSRTTVFRKTIETKNKARAFNLSQCAPHFNHI